MADARGEEEQRVADEERRAKAARAKEKLKKFQAAKAAKLLAPEPASVIIPAPFIEPPPEIAPLPLSPVPVAGESVLEVAVVAPVSIAMENRVSSIEQVQTISLLVAEKQELVLRLEESTLENERVTRANAQLKENETEIRLAQLESDMKVKASQEQGLLHLSTISQKDRELSLASHSIDTLQLQLDSQSGISQDLQAQLLQLNSSTATTDLEDKLKAKSIHADQVEFELSKARKDLAREIVLREGLEEELLEAAGATETSLLELNDLRNDKEEVTAQFSTLESKYQNLITAKEQLELETKSLQANYSEKTTSLSSHISRITSLESETSVSLKKIEVVEKRRDELQNENTGLLLNLEELRSKVVTLSNEQIDLSDQKEDVNRKLRERETELRGSRAEVEKIKIQLNEAKNFLSIGLDEKEMSDATVSGLEEKLSVAQASISALKTELSILEAVKVSQEEQQIELQAANGRIIELELVGTQKNAEVEKELETLREEFQAISTKLQFSVATGAITTTTLETTQKELLQLQQEHSSLLESKSLETEELNESHQALQVEHAALSTKMNGVQSELASVLTSHETLKRDQQSDLDSLALVTAATLETTQKELVQLQQEHSSLLESKSLETEELNESHQALQVEHAALSTKMNGVQSELASVLTSHETLKKDHSQKTESLRADHAAVIAELESSRTLLENEHSVELEGVREVKGDLAKEITKLNMELQQSGNLATETAASAKSALESRDLAIEQSGQEILKEVKLKEEQVFKVRAALESLASTEARLATTQSRLSTSDASRNNSNEEIERITASHNKLLSTNESLNISLDELKTSLATLTHSDSSNAEKAASLTAAASVSELVRETTRTELGSLRIENEKITEELKKMREEDEQGKKDHTELQHEIRSMRLVSESQEATKLELQTSLNSNQVSLESHQAGLESLAISNSELEDSIRSLLLKLKEKTEEIQKMELEKNDEVEIASETIRQRNLALTASDRRASKSDKELRSIMANRDEKDVEIEKLRLEVAELSRGGEFIDEELKTITIKLEKAVSEIESLKSKNSKLEDLQLHPTTSSDSSSPEFDQEYIDSIQAQNDLDLSTARTQIRSLEEKVFAAEDQSHELLKQNGDLKSQMREFDRIEREVEALRAEKYQDRAVFSNSTVAPPPKASPNSLPPPKSSLKSSPKSPSFLPPPPAPIDRARSPLISPPLVVVPISNPVLTSVGRSHQRTASLQLLQTRMEDELGVDSSNGDQYSTAMSGSNRVAIRGDELMNCGCCSGTDVFVC